MDAGYVAVHTIRANVLTGEHRDRDVVDLLSSRELSGGVVEL